MQFLKLFVYEKQEGVQLSLDFVFSQYEHTFQKKEGFHLSLDFVFSQYSHFPKKSLLRSASMSLLTQYEKLVKCSKFTKNI